MTKVLIIDDEAPAREIISRYLQTYSEVEIAGEASDGFTAMKLIREHIPQLIFLDVQMPKLTGFEMLELMDDLPAIIFSTAFDQYAIHAFEHNAVDYLLKPYSKERFDAAMQKALLKIQTGTYEQSELQSFRNLVALPTGELTRIAVKERQQIHVIHVNDIHYIEADGDYVRLHTSKSAFIKEKTMKFLENNLPALQFIRIHRSYIVNVNEVAKIELYDRESHRVHLKSGKCLKASNSGYKALKALLR